MATTLIHCDLSVINSSGESTYIRPQVDGNDVTINANTYGSGQTAQTLVNGLAKMAFNTEFKGINDDAGDGDMNEIYSANKMTARLTDTKSPLTKVKSTYSGWF